MKRRICKARLLNNLQNHTYCRIGVSQIPNAGVGVIAIRDIPEGINPFQRSNLRRNNEYRSILVTESEISGLDPEVQKMIHDFFLPIEERTATGERIYPVVDRGLNGMDISFYLNHSTTPNLDLIPTPNGAYYDFVTNRQIKPGEELLIDYYTD